MRTFAHKQKQTQRTKSSNSVRPGRVFSAQSREVSSILHSQRTIGNQAVQRLLLSNAGECNTALTSITSPNFGHDFSLIPVNPPTARPIQTKSAINKPGGECEQEQDRLAELVMRMPEPEIQRNCDSCARSGTTYQGYVRPARVYRAPISGIDVEPKNDAFEASADRLASTVSGLRTKNRHLPSNRTSPWAARPARSVSELRTGGIPLPPSVRSFFESNLHHDFRDVRVHTGADASTVVARLGASAFTYGNHIWLRVPDLVGKTHTLAHELAHVIQQRSFGNARVQREADPNLERPATPSNRRVVNVVGAETRVSGPYASMAERVARRDGGSLIRAQSMSNMIQQLVGEVGMDSCLGRLNIWNHGAPEIQLVAGQPSSPSERRVYPESGFSLEWLTLPANHPALEQLYSLFCCDATMQWLGCSAASVRASGGIRSQEEGAERRLEDRISPDIYQSSEEAVAHGASLSGARFGMVNVQAWANATCARIVSATDNIDLETFRIVRGGRWIETSPQNQEERCACDSEGRVAGRAPSREEIVRGVQEHRANLLGPENIWWHQRLRVLRSGLPRQSRIVAGRGQFRVRSGTLPAQLREEMQEAHARSARGPLEVQYSRVLFQLIRFASRGITPPSPLPNRPVPNHLHVRIGVGGDWVAATQPHLAVVNRDDFWHWIVFNDRAIGDTPEYTRSVVLHELDHAADLERLLRVFESTNPRPTSPVPRRYRYPADVIQFSSWTDEWGQYINAFNTYMTQNLPTGRHFQIYVNEYTRAEGGYTRWSDQERLDWFEFTFRNVPAGVPSSEPLTGEAEVLAAFAAARPALKNEVLAKMQEIVSEAIDPYREWTNRDERRESRARALTLVTHFEPMITRMLQEHMPALSRDYLIRQLSNG